MDTFPPSNIKNLGHEPVEFWDLFHDGYLTEISYDFRQLSLQVQIELGYPEANNDELTISFQGLASVYSAIWSRPNLDKGDYEAVSFSVSLAEFCTVIQSNKDEFAAIYGATLVECEAGVSIQFDVASGFAINAKSWKWQLNGVEITPAELLSYAQGKWEDWQKRSRK
ncbi:MAG: hypothetical protein KF824_04160 [Fimbriimonadaceae bacterium]|nr:MAG: hypothetical protein KF824_04160 [Fimbriimonadaceae bacterium]